jgi:NitT/TauT family transport system permease protein
VRRRRPSEHGVSSTILPIAVAGLVVALWHLAVVATGIAPYLLPPPLAVANEAWAHAGELAAATLRTGTAAGVALAASVAGGLAVAFVFAQAPLVARSLYPYAIFLQTVPIIAIAPLVIIWSGPGFRSVVVIAFLVAVFPIITSGTTGLTSIDRDLRDLFRVYRASRWQTFWKLRLPHALPDVVTGAQVAGGLAVIGAIVGEVFAGYGADARGLGYLVTVTAAQLKTAYLFAAIIASTLLGLVFFATLGWIRAVVTRRWRDVG